MKNKCFKVRMLITLLIAALWLSFVSCFSGPSVVVDYSLMNNEVPIAQQSQILVLYRISLSTPVTKSQGWSLYVLPAGEHTFVGTYTLYRSVPSSTGSYRVIEEAGAMDFSISHNFLPGQFYYMVGSADENTTATTSRIMILTEEELSTHFSKEYVNSLKEKRANAEQQMQEANTQP